MAAPKARFHSQGANTFRGPKSYSSKTLTGGWYEQRAVPGFGGARPSGLSETDARQRESELTCWLELKHQRLTCSFTALGKKIPKFGAGLFEQEENVNTRYEYGNIVQPDTHATTGDWASVSRKVHGADSGKVAEGSTRGLFVPQVEKKMHSLVSSRSQLREYHARWLGNAEEDERQRRFTTTNSATFPAAAGTSAGNVRVLPGVPKAVEKFRSLIVAKGGVDGIRSVGRLLRAMDDNGDGQLQQLELKLGLEDFGLTFTVDEFQELFKYLDRDGSGSVDARELFLALKPPMGGSRKAIVHQAFDSLTPDANGTVSFEQLLQKFDVHSHSDVVAGLVTPAEAQAQFLSQWAQHEVDGDGRISRDEFFAYHEDLSAAIDEHDRFIQFVQAVWHMPGLAKVETTTVALIITHSTGKKSLQRVPADKFLDLGDRAGILARLQRLGVEDVVSFAQDF